jgi:hypothetical protein
MSNSLKLLAALMLLVMAGCASVAPRADAAGEEGPAGLACGSLGPTTDEDAITRVGARFSRPRNAADLLHNLQLAFATDLIHEPGFYASENLTQFFAGTAATWRERRTISNTLAIRDIVITADESVFPQITINLRRSCSVEVRSDADHGVRADYLREGLVIHMFVGAYTGFTVGAVRDAFGPASTQSVGNGDRYEGPSDELPPQKGVLIYEKPVGRTGIDRAEVTFNVRPDSAPAPYSPLHAPLPGPPPSLNDSDNLGEIRFVESWR